VTARRLAECLVVAALTLLAGACGDGGAAGPREPQVLTAEQATRLASARLRNLQRGSVAFEARMVLDGRQVLLTGAVDWRRHLGSAVVEPVDATVAGGSGSLQWGFGTVARHDGVVEAARGGGGELPGDGWRREPIDATTSTLDALLLVLLNLGADRPENPQLLAQSDARFIGVDEVDGEPAEAFFGPSGAPAGSVAPAGSQRRTTFWLGDDGSMVRVQVLLGESTVATVELSRDPAPDVPFLDDLGPPG